MSEQSDPRKPTESRTVAKAGRGAVEALDRITLQRRYRTLRNLVVLLAAVVVVLLGVTTAQWVQLNSAAARATGAAAQSGEGGSGETQPAEASGEGCAVPTRDDPSDPMSIGSPDAPVVIAEWTDFRCPYCGVFARDTLPLLQKEYIDTGKVRLEIHDADFIDGEVSARVAVAVRAAGEQGRYFEYLHAVYDAMENGRPEITDAILVGYAEQAGVPDVAAFTKALDDPELLQAVTSSSSTARDLGVDSVPIFIDTSTCQALKGAQPVENFRKFLDDAVAQAEKRES